VDLVGALSRTETQALLQRLTSDNPHQARSRPERRPAENGPHPGGRRRFGTVSGAIVQILSEAETELRVGDIKTQVERLLGSSVSRHSVKSQLHRGCYRDPPLFERLARGIYRLR
jgi:hypothetical protein